jgi:hypothetical protein
MVIVIFLPGGVMEGIRRIRALFARPAAPPLRKVKQEYAK